MANTIKIWNNLLYRYNLILGFFPTRVIIKILSGSTRKPMVWRLYKYRNYVQYHMFKVCWRHLFLILSIIIFVLRAPILTC